MLHRHHVATCLIVVGLAAALVALRPTPPTGPDTRRAPNEWSFLERAFPYDSIPIEVWRAAQRQAASDRAAESTRGAVWTARGPDNIGGRITDVVVDPTNDSTVFAGAAEGGVFRTFDGGQSWTPLFDQMPSLAIGALALEPGNPNVVYAGTGEVNPGGGSVAYGGSGLYRSTDQGDSWSLIGLEDSGTIGRIVVDPSDPLTIFVAANGMQWQASTERGVYRSTDGGATWDRVLYTDDVTGCVDLVQRPDDPDVILAAMWQHIRQPEYYDYGGPGCAVHRSTDGGDSWSVVGGGLPAPSANGGRIGLSLCRSQPQVMHAVYADRTGYFAGLYRSTDGGDTWARTNDTALNDVFASYGWWFGNVRTHPMDPDTIYVLGLDFYMSSDGGASWVNASDEMHVDHHGLDFGPGSSPVIYNGNDGGMYRSTNGGTAWTKLPDQPLTQVYRLGLDQQNPGAIYLGAQDNGTCRTFTPALDDWEHIFGGDGFQPLIHPLNPNKIWALYQYGNLFVSTDGGTIWRSAMIGISFSDRKNWNTPLIQDPADPDLRYTATHRVYRSTADRNWTVISGDLTGGPHMGNPGQVDGSITTLSVSPLDTSVLWAGSNDGHVHVSTDDGDTWTDVSAGLPERWVTSVRADPFVRETAYVTISGFRWTEPLPHVFQTTDLGSTWTPIAGTLPEAPVNDLAADPTNQGRLFVATDVGVYQTLDGGLSWTMLGADLPNAITTSLALDPSAQTLLVGTYGRSVFSAAIAADLLFADGFETGDGSRWARP
jgi:photosystem II stability/assembly factor-like uncharacterized protein